MADFTLNAPGTTNNPYAPANVIIPVGTLASNATGIRRGSLKPFAAHDSDYGSSITSAVTIAARLASDFVYAGAVVRTGGNAGAFVGVYYNGNTEMRIVRLNAAGTQTTISNTLTVTALSVSDYITCVYNTGTGAVTASINGGSNLAFTGTTTDSTYAAEASLAAGFGFDPQNSNGTYISKFEGTGIAGGAFQVAWARNSNQVIM